MKKETFISLGQNFLTGMQLALLGKQWTVKSLLKGNVKKVLPIVFVFLPGCSSPTQNVSPYMPTELKNIPPKELSKITGIPHRDRISFEHFPINSIDGTILPHVPSVYISPGEHDIATISGHALKICQLTFEPGKIYNERQLISMIDATNCLELKRGQSYDHKTRKVINIQDLQKNSP